MLERFALGCYQRGGPELDGQRRGLTESVSRRTPTINDTVLVAIGILDIYFTFVVDEHSRLSVTDDGKQVLDEAPFLASSTEARRLLGYRGAMV